MKKKIQESSIIALGAKEEPNTRDKELEVLINDHQQSNTNNNNHVTQNFHKSSEKPKRYIKGLHIEYSGYSNTEQHRRYPSYNLYSIYIGNATVIQRKITNSLKQETNQSGNVVKLSKY